MSATHPIDQRSPRAAESAADDAGTALWYSDPTGRRVILNLEGGYQITDRLHRTILIDGPALKELNRRLWMWKPSRRGNSLRWTLRQRVEPHRLVIVWRSADGYRRQMQLDGEDHAISNHTGLTIWIRAVDLAEGLSQCHFSEVASHPKPITLRAHLNKKDPGAPARATGVESHS